MSEGEILGLLPLRAQGLSSLQNTNEQLQEHCSWESNDLHTTGVLTVKLSALARVH